MKKLSFVVFAGLMTFMPIGHMSAQAQDKTLALPNQTVRAVSANKPAILTGYRVVDLGVPDGDLNGYNDASAINNSGQIVGSAEATNGTRAIYWANSSSTPVDINATVQFSSANSINNSGQIVGSVGFNTYPSQSYVLYWPNSSNAPVIIGTLGAYWKSYAAAINDNGQIVGDTKASGVLPDAIATYWANSSSVPVDI